MALSGKAVSELSDVARAELREHIRPMYALLRAFADGSISGGAYERAFFEQWPELVGRPSPPAEEAAERYFQLVDDWTDDPSLRDGPDEITTAELRRRTADLLRTAGYTA